MGEDTRDIFQMLRAEGYGFLVSGFHVKGQAVGDQGGYEIRRFGLWCGLIEESPLLGSDDRDSVK